MEKVKTIFVIEDSRILSEIIALQLRREFKCKVSIFENGDDVVNQIKKYSPDLIVLDYNLNESGLNYCSGLEVLVELRKKHKTPVIVFSGQTDKQKALEIVRKGANDYISKDDDDFMSALLQSVQDVFEIQNAKKNIDHVKSKIKNNFLFFIFLLTLSTVVYKYMSIFK
jgi:DNA-binding NtrC family response regulator